MPFKLGTSIWSPTLWFTILASSTWPTLCETWVLWRLSRFSLPTSLRWSYTFWPKPLATFTSRSWLTRCILFWFLERLETPFTIFSLEFGFTLELVWHRNITIVLLAGPVDLKLFGEIRWSWFILFSLTLSSAVHQYQTYHELSIPMIFMLCAHFIYANATAKGNYHHWLDIVSALGEEMVIVSFDLVYEKWGWLLIFWNFAGVPFLYCASSVYLYKQYVFSFWCIRLISRPASFDRPTWVYVVCFFLLFVGYYIFDTANAQKNSFRMRLRDPNWKPRYASFSVWWIILICSRTFPQLPWAYLPETADHLKTEVGMPSLFRVNHLAHL